MDKIDDRYKNGKIYEITSNNIDMIYVGSCIITLNQRLINHKSKKQRCSSKSIIECGDYNINLIEEYSCNNKRQLESREQYWIDKYRTEGKNVINKQNAYMTEEQNKEYYKIRNSEYYANNREKFSEYNKQYYVNNREKNKEYRDNNREKIIEYKREFRFMNKKEYVNACYDFLEMLKHY